MNRMKALKETFADGLVKFILFVESNLRNLALFLEALLPFVVYSLTVLGHNFYVILAAVFIYWFAIWFIKSYANKIGKGITVPTPSRRFTEEDEFNEITIDSSRIKELIIYMADLEDWLYKKGLTKK